MCLSLSSRKTKPSTFQIIALAVFFLFGSGCTVDAQKSSKSTTTKINEPVTPVAPIAQESTKKKQKPQQSAEPPPTGWITQCTKEGQQKDRDCKIEQTIILKKTQQRILSVIVRVPAESPNPAMMIHLPLGFFLPNGVSLQLDQEVSLNLNVQTCDANGCYCGTPISENMLVAMKTGNRMMVSFQSLAKETVSIPVPLAGFAIAYQKVR
jgi:invasion protein IalB